MNNFLPDFSSTKIRPCRGAWAARATTRLNASKGTERETPVPPQASSHLQGSRSPQVVAVRDSTDDGARRALLPRSETYDLSPGPKRRTQTHYGNPGCAEFEQLRNRWERTPTAAPPPAQPLAWIDAGRAGLVGIVVWYKVRACLPRTTFPTVTTRTPIGVRPGMGSCGGLGVRRSALARCLREPRPRRVWKRTAGSAFSPYAL